MIAVAVAGMALSVSAAREPLCNYAKIIGRHPAVVHLQHDNGSKVVARLKPATTVYACDDYRNEDLTNRWIQVSFADAMHSCQGSTNGLAVSRAAFCRVGWVRESRVETISG